jgi:hypothetical protein
MDSVNYFEPNIIISFSYKMECYLCTPLNNMYAVKQTFVNCIATEYYKNFYKAFYLWLLFW